MKDYREEAIDEAFEIVDSYMDALVLDRYNREEARNTLGKSWPNLIDIAVDGGAKAATVQETIEHLRDEGYLVSIESNDVIEMHVSTSRDVVVRHRDGEKI